MRKTMSTVAENETNAFNLTRTMSQEDSSRNLELAMGFYEMETRWNEGANPHPSDQGEMPRLLVSSKQRSAPVSCTDVCAVAVSPGPTTGWTTCKGTSEGDCGDPGMSTSLTNLRRFLSIEETAAYTGLSRHTLYTMVSQRRIPFVKMGRLTKFDVALLDDWIKQHTVMPMPNKAG
jgi:excisionase family DNA binding protein